MARIFLLTLICVSCKSALISVPDFVSSLRECLLIFYTPFGIDSDEWANYAADSIISTHVPSIHYRELEPHSSEHRLFIHNLRTCNVYLIFIPKTQKDCSTLLLEVQKLPGMRQTSNENDLIVFVTPGGKSCVTSAPVTEDAIEVLGHEIVTIRENAIFLQISQHHSKQFDIAQAYRFYLFCTKHKWTCFVKLQLQLADIWTQFKNEIPNFNKWNLVFFARFYAVYSEEEIELLKRFGLVNFRVGSRKLGIEQIGAASLNKIAIYLAEKYNFTVKSCNHKCVTPQLPFQNTSEMERRSVLSAGFVIRLQIGDESTKLISVDPSVRTFMYCRNSTEVHARESNVRAFLSRFDHYIWICLVVSFILVCILCNRLSVTFDEAVINVFAALLLQMHVRYRDSAHPTSPILLIWTFVSIVLSVCYLGGFESMLVAPMETQGISTFEELAANSYRILVKNRTRTYQMVTAKNQNSFNSTSYLRKLRDTADIVPNYEFGMHMCLLRRAKRALFDSSKNLKQFKILIEKHVDGRECFIGSQMLYVYPKFWAFENAYTVALARGFLKIIQSGIYNVLNRIHEDWDTKWEAYAVREGYENLSTSKKNQQDEDRKMWTSFSIYNPQALIVFRLLAYGFCFNAAAFGLEWISCFVYKSVKFKLLIVLGERIRHRIATKLEELINF